MATGADKLRAYALRFIGVDAYEWGEVPAPWEKADGDPMDGDCSGFSYACWRTGGVPDVVLDGRQTAHDYYRRGKRIDSKDAVCGDYICLLNSDGHAHHIIMCIGKGETMEARGENYGYEHHTVSECMKRSGAVCMRMPNVRHYTGDLTVEKRTYKVMACSTANSAKNSNDIDFEAALIALCKKHGKALYECTERADLPDWTGGWYRKG